MRASLNVNKTRKKQKKNEKKNDMKCDKTSIFKIIFFINNYIMKIYRTVNRHDKPSCLNQYLLLYYYYYYDDV